MSELHRFFFLFLRPQMGSRQILTILILTNTLLSFITPTHCSSSKSENVTVSLYYETLCPYCANFIVNYLVKIFQNGLISIVNLRMVPWGNAWINKSDGSFICQVTSPSPSTFFLSFSYFLFHSNLFQNCWCDKL